MSDLRAYLDSQPWGTGADNLDDDDDMTIAALEAERDDLREANARLRDQLAKLDAALLTMMRERDDALLALARRKVREGVTQ